MTKNPTAIVTITPNVSDEFVVNQVEEAIAERDTLLLKIEAARPVSTVEEQDALLPVIADVNGFIKDMEEKGLSARRPYRKVCDEIMEFQRSLTEKLQTASKRATGFISAFQAAEKIKAERARAEEERKRKEALRLEQEAIERLAMLERKRIAAEEMAESNRVAAEAARIAAEAAIVELEKKRKQAVIDAANAKDQAARNRGAAVLARIKREAAEAATVRANAQREEAEMLAREARESAKLDAAAFAAEVAAESAANNTTAICSAPVVETPTGVKGGRVGRVPDITVTDINALNAKYPQCVKKEPKLQAIKDLANAGIENIPGVSIIWRINASVNAARRSSVAESLPFE